MGVTIRTENHNKLKNYTSQYMNWFDQRKSENSRYGVGWMDRVEGPKIADGIFKLICDFEKGKINIDTYKEAFDSSNFTTNATPALDGRARELSIIVQALNGMINNAFTNPNSIKLEDRDMVIFRKTLYELEINEYNTVSNYLKAYAISKNRTELESMMDMVGFIAKKRRNIEDTFVINKFESSGLKWGEYETSLRRRGDAKRIISQMTRPKFVMRDFVNSLKKDCTIIPFILQECEENIRFVTYIQSGIMLVSIDDLSKAYFNKLIKEKTAYEMIKAEFEAVNSALQAAFNMYYATGGVNFIFPTTIEYSLSALQTKLVTTYRGIL